MTLASAPAGAAPSDAVDGGGPQPAGFAAERREDGLARDLFERLNDERARRQLHPLRWDPALADLAYDWSRTMAETDRYAHRPQGQRDVQGYAGVGENIHQLLPQHAFTGHGHRGWMRSTGHRNNIVNPGYDAVGIGVFCGVDGRMWLTQNLGRYTRSSSPPLEYGDTPEEPVVHDSAEGLSCEDLPAMPRSGGSGPAPGAGALQPPQGVTYLRAAGPSRIETAVEVSRLLFDDGADTVVLGRADAFADALTGAVLAGAADGPVLLTRAHSLPAEVREEIERLDPSTVYVLGGSSAIAPGTLRGLPGNVVRLAGADRYATAARAADEIARLRGASHGHVYLANGATGWPDAVAVSGLAAFRGDPLLLSARDTLPSAARGVIERGNVTEVTLVGGSAALSGAVEAELRGLGIDVRRIAGATRYETAALARDAAIGTGMSPRVTLLATLRDWPDSLVVGAAAARQRGIVLSVSGRDAGAEPRLSYAYADAHREKVEHVTVIGGGMAVSDAVVARLFDHMRR